MKLLTFLALILFSSGCRPAPGLGAAAGAAQGTAAGAIKGAGSSGASKAAVERSAKP